MAVTLAHPAPTSSRPYIPESDAEILERLPGPVANGLPRTKLEPAVAPADPVSAVARARSELTRYQQSADPRYLGRAEAALGNFWAEPAPPEPVLVLRARIRQSNHEFLPALADLDQALVASPRDGQALLDRASIHTVLGHYEQASRDCETLGPLVEPLYALMCRAAIAGVTGSAGPAYSELAPVAEHARDPGDACWAESLLGELSLRIAEYARAESHFRRVLATCPNDSYARGALSDLLLDLGRLPEVVALLSDQTRQDALLLRLTIAERQLHAASFDAHVSDLKQRFEEAALRGSQVHRREEARFQLWLRDAAEAALALALANFAVQREPADVRVALESALAAGRPASVHDVLSFVAATGLQDPRITSLIARLRR